MPVPSTMKGGGRILALNLANPRPDCKFNDLNDMGILSVSTTSKYKSHSTNAEFIFKLTACLPSASRRFAPEITGCRCLYRLNGQIHEFWGSY